MSRKRFLWCLVWALIIISVPLFILGAFDALISFKPWSTLFYLLLSAYWGVNLKDMIVKGMPQ